MNTEEIIRMAQEVGLLPSYDVYVEDLERFFHMAQAAEREAWIEALRPAITKRMGAEQVREAIQTAIRARGNK